ncbi:hypothetical protein T458_06610 [Brevibacillus panacihumi W25]|uniref:Uncharacterized protein n=1 Tax=Brevibacillus panacihumi W25 TaxID=1408254 RepID=V6MA85_9BACL|nr:hypothetical protein [Brevibacillus panacihumi]EST55444.1 hypothetical protein T458_06610 [Brevibacillus panacihumi W25]
MKGARKPGILVLAGVLAAGSLCVTPLMEASAFAGKKVQAAATVTPVPLQVSKGIQQVVKLVPELAKTHVAYVGEVDGPGVSGVAVAFAKSASDPDTQSNRAIFDPVTGGLLVLELAPQKAEKPALTDQQASTRALAFVTSLENGNTYQAYEITVKDGLTTVRLVRKINHVLLDDAYDSFVTFDSTGRLVGFRNFNGKSHEKLIPATFPSAQRVISAPQAAQLFMNSQPLELVYLLPEKGMSGQRQEARLVYVIKDGVIKQSHTGGAFDAVNGKRLLESAAPQTSKTAAQAVTINGTGENWSALTAGQAANVVRALFKNEPGKLPLVSFDQTLEDGQVLRYFIWGHFRPDAKNEDKMYELGLYPDAAGSSEKKHIMLVTDAKTGELLRYVSKNDQAKIQAGDGKQVWNAAEATLKRLLPSGPTPLRVSNEGSGGEDKTVLINADPVVNGIPVYREGQTAAEGMYSLLYRGGALEEVILNRSDDLVFPQASKAISQQAAAQHLLKALPLELSYVHLTNPETGAVTWKLAYDLSFRQARAHCFCGPGEKVDTTVQVDAFSGKVTVKE